MIKDHICSASPLSLGEMVDLQAALERDADEDEQILIDRDVAIGRQIGAADQPDVDAVRGWLQQVQAGDKPAFGRALERRGLTLAWLIRTGAFFAGGLTVAGWLEVQGRQPINVINFWAAVIGTQLVFLIFLAYSTARWRWAARYARAGGASD